MNINKKNTITNLLMNRLLVATIAINIVAVIIIANSVSSIVRTLETEHLSEIVDNMSLSIVATIEKYIQLAEVISKNTAIIELMVESDKENPMHLNPNKNNVVDELHTIALNFEGSVINFGLLDIEQDGYLTQDGGFSDPDFSFAERSYYSVVTTKKPVVTSPYLDNLTGLMVLSVVTPVMDRNDRVLGAILIDLSMDFLSELIITSEYGQTGSGLIVDDANIILAYRDASFIGKPLESLNLVSEHLLAELKNPSRSLIEYPKDGVQKIGMAGVIDAYNWKILTFMELTEFNWYPNQIVKAFVFIQIISIIIMLIVATLTINFSLKPIQDIKEALQQIALGNTDFELEYTSDNEIGDLADNVRYAGQNLTDYINKIKYQLDYDDLTLLFTESKFIKATRELLDKNKTDVYSIFAFDIDNFKYINDTYGYKKGSELLKELGLFFNTVIAGVTPVARINADNYLFLLNESQFADFKKNHDAYFEAISQKACGVIGEHYDLSISCGIYVIENPSLDVSSMIDCATYAKNKGKFTIGVSVNYYGDNMNDERSANNYVVSKMREGAKNKEFVIYYQPKVDLVTNKIEGAEALVRWISNNQLIPPDKFIPVFETNGFIETLDYYTINSTCEFIKEHSDKGLPLISVNLSGVTIMKKDVVSQILSIVEKHELKPEQIELEITESAFVNNFDVAMEKIIQFRKLGFSISMDDFGCGVSSLGRLKNMPIDVIKIDREFIVDSFKNDKADLILKNIVNMAKDLQLKTVVEGIETKDQLKFITELGCELGQGYIFSRPVPQDDFLTMLKNDRTIIAKESTPPNKTAVVEPKDTSEKTD